MKKYLKTFLVGLMMLASFVASAQNTDGNAEDAVANDKKGQRFEEKKARKIEMLEARLACVRAASNRKEIKACKPQANKKKKDAKKSANKQNKNRKNSTQ